MASCPGESSGVWKLFCAALCRIQSNDSTAVAAPGVHVTALHAGTPWDRAVNQLLLPSARSSSRTVRGRLGQEAGRSTKSEWPFVEILLFLSFGALCLAPCPWFGGCFIENYNVATSQLYVTLRGELKTVAFPRAHGTGRCYAAHFSYVAVCPKLRSCLFIGILHC